MTDLYTVEVASVRAAEVELWISPTTAIAAGSREASRSFALQLLYAAGRDLRAGHTPLVRALLALGYGARLRTVDWYARHVPAFIGATAVVEGRDDRVTADAEASAPPPSWLLRIELTEERWLEGIEVGARFGTTGDAVGHEDPLEPPHPGVRRHERPRPPSGGAGKWREDTASFRVRPASTAEIRSWSHGEVKKPETINSATFEPEPDGLFCQKVFGPIRDHQCECARQVSDEERGAVCNRCGVRLTDAAVRSRWLGHIELAGPVVHPWFRESASVVLTVLPVLPADLRSMLPVDAAGRLASSAAHAPRSDCLTLCAAARLPRKSPFFAS